MDIKVSEDLATTDQRAVVESMIQRMTPGIQHTYLSKKGALKSGVNLYRQPRKIKVTAPR
jgi:hypothetical protein